VMADIFVLGNRPGDAARNLQKARLPLMLRIF